MIPVTPLKEPLEEPMIVASLQLVRDTGFLTEDEIGWVEQTLTRPEPRYDGFAILEELFAACKQYIKEREKSTPHRYMLVALDAAFRELNKALWWVPLLGTLLGALRRSVLLRLDQHDLQPWEAHRAKRVIRGILHARQIVAYKQRSVLIAVPQRVQHPKHAVPCLHGFHPGQHIYARVQSVFGMDYAEARNALVNAALSEDTITHILFIDDDVLIPRDGLQKLLEYNLPIVSGTYVKKNVQLETGVTAIGQDTEYIVGQQQVPYKHGDMDPIVVSCTGGGFILINVDVFSKFGPDETPYEFMLTEDGRVRVGEDSLFIQKCAAKGIKTAVVPGLCALHVDFTKGGRGLDVETYGPTELVDPVTRRVRPEYAAQYLSFPDDADFDVSQLVAADAKDFFGKNIALKEKGLIK